MHPVIYFLIALATSSKSGKFTPILFFVFSFVLLLFFFLLQYNDIECQELYREIMS